VNDYALAAVFFLLVSMGEKSIVHGWMYAFVPLFIAYSASIIDRKSVV